MSSPPTLQTHAANTYQPLRENAPPPTKATKGIRVVKSVKFSASSFSACSSAESYTVDYDACSHTLAHELLGTHQYRSSIKANHDVWLKDASGWAIRSASVPKLCLSLVGGTSDFDVPQTLLSEIMTTAQQVTAWVFTNGSNSGLAQYFGLSRAKSGWDVPLIAVAMLDTVVRNDIFQYEGDSIYSPLGVPTTGNEIVLEPNHSAYILVRSTRSDGTHGPSTTRSVYDGKRVVAGHAAVDPDVKTMPVPGRTVAVLPTPQTGSFSTVKHGLTANEAGNCSDSEAGSDHSDGGVANGAVLGVDAVGSADTLHAVHADGRPHEHRDGGASSGIDAEDEMRNSLEKSLCSLCSRVLNSTVTRVCVVMGGWASTPGTVHRRLSQCVPVVCIRKTGRTADLLCGVLDLYERGNGSPQALTLCENILRGDGLFAGDEACVQDIILAIQNQLLHAYPSLHIHPHKQNTRPRRPQHPTFAKLLAYALSRPIVLRKLLNSRSKSSQHSQASIRMDIGLLFGDQSLVHDTLNNISDYLPADRKGDADPVAAAVGVGDDGNESVEARGGRVSLISRGLVRACIQGNLPMVSLLHSRGGPLQTQRIGRVRRVLASFDEIQPHMLVSNSRATGGMPEEMLLLARLFAESDWSHFQQPRTWHTAKPKIDATTMPAEGTRSDAHDSNVGSAVNNGTGGVGGENRGRMANGHHKDIGTIGTSAVPKDGIESGCVTAFQKLLRSTSLSKMGSLPEGTTDLAFCEAILQHADLMIASLLGVGYAGRLGVDSVYERNLDKPAVSSYDLALWAAAANFPDLAYFFWERSQPKVQGALVLARLYQGMANSEIVHNPAIFSIQAKRFENIASECIKLIDDREPGMGASVLRTHCFVWRNETMKPKSYLDVAIEGSMSDFFAANQSICIEALETRILRGISPRQKSLAWLGPVDNAVCLCLFFWWCIPFLEFDRHQIGLLAGPRGRTFVWGREVPAIDTPSSPGSGGSGGSGVSGGGDGGDGGDGRWGQGGTFVGTPGARQRANTQTVQIVASPMRNRLGRGSATASHMIDHIQQALGLGRDVLPPCRVVMSQQQQQLSFLNWTLRVSSSFYAPHRFAREKFLCFIRSPMVRYYFHMGMYLTFLILFTAANIRRFCETRPTNLEWMVFVWVLALFFEELDQVQKAGIKLYLQSVWNVIDATMCASYFIGFGFRVAAASEPVLHDDTGCQVPHFTRQAKTFIGISAVMFYLRALEVFRVHELLGPLLVVIGKMIIVLAPFAFLFGVVSMGFGVAMAAILTEEEVIPQNEEMDWLVTMYWMIFGEQTLDDVSKTSFLFPSVLLAIYLVTAIVLLLNLLIAILTTSYEEVLVSSKAIWFREFVETIDDYRRFRSFAVPFTIVFRIKMAFRKTWRLSRRYLLQQTYDTIFPVWKDLCLETPAHSGDFYGTRWGCHRPQLGSAATGREHIFDRSQLENDILLRREEFKVLLDGLFNSADPIVVDVLRFRFLSGVTPLLQVKQCASGQGVIRDYDVTFESQVFLTVGDHVQVYLPTAFELLNLESGAVFDESRLSIGVVPRKVRPANVSATSAPIDKRLWTLVPFETLHARAFVGNEATMIDIEFIAGNPISVDDIVKIKIMGIAQVDTATMLQRKASQRSRGGFSGSGQQRHGQRGSYGTDSTPSTFLSSNGMYPDSLAGNRASCQLTASMKLDDGIYVRALSRYVSFREFRRNLNFVRRRFWTCSVRMTGSAVSSPWSKFLNKVKVAFSRVESNYTFNQRQFAHAATELAANEVANRMRPQSSNGDDDCDSDRTSDVDTDHDDIDIDGAGANGGGVFDADVIDLRHDDTDDATDEDNRDDSADNLDRDAQSQSHSLSRYSVRSGHEGSRRSVGSKMSRRTQMDDPNANKSFGSPSDGGCGGGDDASRHSHIDDMPIEFDAAVLGTPASSVKWAASPVSAGSGGDGSNNHRVIVDSGDSAHAAAGKDSTAASAAVEFTISPVEAERLSNIYGATQTGGGAIVGKLPPGLRKVSPSRLPRPGEESVGQEQQQPRPQPQLQLQPQPYQQQQTQAQMQQPGALQAHNRDQYNVVDTAHHPHPANGLHGLHGGGADLRRRRSQHSYDRLDAAADERGNRFNGKDNSPPPPPPRRAHPQVLHKPDIRQPFASHRRRRSNSRGGGGDLQPSKAQRIPSARRPAYSRDNADTRRKPVPVMSPNLWKTGGAARAARDDIDDDIPRAPRGAAAPAANIQLQAEASLFDQIQHGLMKVTEGVASGLNDLGDGITHQIDRVAGGLKHGFLEVAITDRDSDSEAASIAERYEYLADRKVTRGSRRHNTKDGRAAVSAVSADQGGPTHRGEYRGRGGYGTTAAVPMSSTQLQARARGRRDLANSGWDDAAGDGGEMAVC